MERVAVVTLVIGDAWPDLARVTLPSQREYARRIGADFHIIDRPTYPHIHYEKWQMCDLLATYDRLIYLDADMIVRPDCPDLCVMVPPQYVAGENELPSYARLAGDLQRFAERLGVGPVPCPHYLNAGLLVLSSCHRNLLRQPEIVPVELPYPEQSHFNLRLIMEKVPVVFLPPTFNDRHRRGQYYLRQSFILHYAAMPFAERITAAEKDLVGWNELFSRPGRRGNAPTHG